MPLNNRPELADNARFTGNTKRAIAAWWRASGATQEEAALHAGVNVSTIGRWERNDDLDYWKEIEAARRTLKRTAWAEAWYVVRQHLRNEDPAMVLRAAHEIISSVDRDSPQRHEVTGADGGPIEERRYVIVRPIAVEEGDA